MTLRSVLRNDGYYWLAVDTPTRLIYLYRMGRIGECFRPGFRNWGDTMRK